MPYSAHRLPTHAALRRSHRPMSAMNITPLIEVMLVLLIMFIMVIPLATHAVQIPIPTGDAEKPILETNTVYIDSTDHLYWNGQAVNREELLNQLAATAARPEEPLVQFEPDRLASYDASAKTIALIKDSGVTKFAFVGNHKYRDFAREM